MKRGFTLIELLAVIVILAIIALIATPIILGIINDAKEDSNKRSVENYAHAVELAVARYAADKGGKIPFGEFEITSDGKQLKQGNLLIEVDYKGEKMEGKVTVLDEDGKEGQIKLEGIKINGGNKAYNYSEKDGVTLSGDVSTGVEEETALVLATGDISAAQNGSVTYTYYDNGKLKISGSGQVRNFGEFSTVRDYTLANLIIRDIIYSDASQGVKDILDGVNFKEETIDSLTYLDWLFTGAYTVFGINSDQELINMASSSIEDEPTRNNYLATLNLVVEKVPKVTSIILEEGITNISDGMFFAYATQSIKLPSTVKSIDSWAMPMCGDVTLNEGLLSIGDEGLFTYNGTTIEIPSTVTHIDEDAFSDSQLTTVKILGDSTRFDANWSNLFGSATII